MVNVAVKNKFKYKCPKCGKHDIVKMRYEPLTKTLHFVCCNEKCTAKGIQKAKLDEVEEVEYYSNNKNP